MKFQPLIFIGLVALATVFVNAQDSDRRARSENAFETTVKLQGVLNPIETLRLATRDPGIIEEVLVAEGDSVSAGETIAVLDTSMYVAEVNAAKNELLVAKEETKNDVDLQYAKISRAVNEKVYQRSLAARTQFAKSISKTELEKLRLESERSRLSGLQAERERSIKQLNEALKTDRLTIAKIRMENRTIKSKIDGTVVEVFQKPGEFVNTGQPIARILNLNRLRVVCAGRKGLNPNDVPKKATFKIEIDGEVVSYPAKLTFVSPEIDPVRQSFPIWAEIQNTDGRLHSGQVGALEFKAK